MRVLRLAALVLLCAVLVSASRAAAAPSADGANATADAAFQYAMARLLAGDGDQEGAEAAFRNAISLDESAAYLRAEFASFLLQRRRFDEASKQATEGRRLAPQDPEVLRTFGIVQFERARALRRPELLSDAIEAFEALREIDPGDLQGMLALGQIYQLRGDLDQAVEVYEELLSHHADNDRLKRLVIDTLGQAGESEKAKALLAELVRLDRDALDSRMTLAEDESSKGNHAGAIEILEGARERDYKEPRFVLTLALEYLLSADDPELTPKQRAAALERAEALADTMADGESRPAALRLKAQVALARQDAAAARDLLQQAVAADPSDPRAALDLADLLASQDEKEAASAVLSKLAESQGKDPQILRLLVQRFSGLEDWQTVLKLTQQALPDATDRQRAFLVSAQADALVGLDRAKDAVTLLEGESKAPDASPFFTFRRAELLIDMGRKKEAIRVLSEEAKANSDAPELVVTRARLMFRAERDDLAFAALDQLVAADPATGALQVGQFLSALERYQDAVRYFKQGISAIDAASDEAVLADAHFLLGATYERTGEIEAAADQFKTVLQLRQDDSDAMNYLGYMWADKGMNLDEALSLVERAVQIQPGNGSYVDSLGWAQFRLGHYEDARKSLEHAVDLTPDNATIHEHLGDVYQALGETERARAAYQKALSLGDADDPDALRSKLQLLESPER